MTEISNRGEIFHAGQIMERTDAQRIGGAIIRAHQQLREKGTTLLNHYFTEAMDEDTGYDEMSGLFVISSADMSVIETTQQAFYDLILERYGVQANLTQDLLFDGPNASAWHIDYDQSYRLLLNLSDVPLDLRVATKWEPVYSDPLAYAQDPPAPSEYTTLTYDIGEAIILNNACDPMGQVPHAGMSYPDKVVLRMFA